LKRDHFTRHALDQRKQINSIARENLVTRHGTFAIGMGGRHIFPRLTSITLIPQQAKLALKPNHH